MKGSFSDIYCGNLIKILEVNLKIFWGPPDDRVPLEFLISQSFSLWASRNLSIIVQVFLPWHWFPGLFLLLILCSGKPLLSAFTHLSLQSRGHEFALCPPLSCGSKKSHWFFSPFSFLLIVMEWHHPSSLQVEQKFYFQFIFSVFQFGLILYSFLKFPESVLCHLHFII